jgi:RNA recognition motif-containing protein
MTQLPFHCQWQDLKDLFRQAGTIIRADVALGPDGRSRGFGTVVFATDLDAERAVKIFNGWVTMPHSNITHLHLHLATNTTDAH